MNIAAYLTQFESVLQQENTEKPYDNEAYVHYVKMNASRVKRWSKTAKITPEIKATIQQIKHPQTWVLITEPWCGDAANSQVFIDKISQLNPLITLEIQNRDSAESEIDNYLTNGGKSIPKLIVRDEKGQDLFTWGPRPKEAQEKVQRWITDKSITLEERMIKIQQWYNTDKGQSLQQELDQLLLDTIS